MEMPLVSSENLTKHHCYCHYVAFHLPHLAGTDTDDALSCSFLA